MKFWTTLTMSFLSFSWCYSEPQTSGPNTIRVFELDGSPDGRIRNISLSGCTLVIDGSTAVITCTGTGGGGDNFGSHVATMAANFQGQFAIIGATSIVASSVTAWVSMTSSNGFQGGGSSFTSIAYYSTSVVQGFTQVIGSFTATDVIASTKGIITSIVRALGSTLGNSSTILLAGGNEITPVLRNSADNNGFWVDNSGSGQGWHLAVSGAGSSVQSWFRNPSQVQIGRQKAASKDKVASVIISTNLTNVPIVAVTSDTLKFSISGASATSNVVFAVIPSSSNAFSDNPSSYSFLVSSPIALGQTAATEKFAFSIATTTHINSNGVSPALTNCGTSPTVFGSDNAFTITVGATAGGCTATFAQAFFNTPTCTISPQTGSVVNTISYTVSNSAVVITETGISGNVDVHCIGHD